MKKKLPSCIFAALLAGCMVFAAVGCGGGVPSESDGVRQEQSDEGSVPPVSDLTSDGGNENGGNEHEEEAEIMYMYIGGGRAEVALAENEATKALTGLLEGGDIVCTADDYGGFEKVGALGHSLPASNSRIDARPGDVMLYQGNQIVVFYGSNSWSYTPVGRIQGLSAAELEAFLGAGQGEVQIRLSLH